jgi:protein phosphatase
MQFAARTDPGRREGDNEDSIGADEARALWLVADGMGGHASGRLASQIVCEKLLELAADRSLEDAVLGAHAAVQSAVQGHPELDGMGSTVVAAQIRDGVCHIVWVGDSRAYLWRGGSLIRLTRDHSMREMQAPNSVSPQENDRAASEDRRIFQALGRGDPQPSRVDLQLESGDRILLASDGLNGELADDEVAAVLGSSADPASAADALISAALAKGGRDNVSTIVVDVETLDHPHVDDAPARSGSASLWPAVLVGVALALVASFVWWQWWMRQ